MAVCILSFLLAGCGQQRSPSQKDTSDEVSAESVGGTNQNASNGCALIRDGSKFCYKDRASKYFLHEDSPEYYERFAELTQKGAHIDEFKALIDYSIKLVNSCRQFATEEHEKACGFISLHGLTEEDVNALRYRALLYLEGKASLSNFTGKIVTHYEPIFDQHDVIEWYYDVSARDDRRLIPEVTALYDIWESGKSKHSDYEYFLAVHSKCELNSAQLELDDQGCIRMMSAVATIRAVDSSFDIRKVADWYYIATVYNLDIDA
jgi:hypothetical protein